QQPNTPTATAAWNGLSGPPWPITLWVPSGSTLTYQVSGLPFRSFALVDAPAGLSPGALSPPFGIVDLNLSAGYAVVMDGVGLGLGGNLFLDSLAHLGASGQFYWGFPLPQNLSGSIGAMQTLVVDQASPAGLRLTA